MMQRLLIAEGLEMKFHIVCLAICVTFLYGAWGETAFGQTTIGKVTQTPSTNMAMAAPAPLFNCITGNVVGYKDPKTGNLVFTSKNAVIQRSKIKRVSKQEFERLVHDKKLDALKMYKPPPRVIPAWNPRVPAAIAEGSGCVSMCWYMSEGGATIQGCAKDLGEGACFVWEYASDYESSTSPAR
jgi:hypothetical protein